MKKILYFVSFFVFILFSCENEKSVQSNIDKLRSERTELHNEINTINTQISTLNEQKNLINQHIETLQQEVKELEIYKSGRTPKYILTLHLKQSHFSLDIGKHIKDAMNAIDFEIPVDKEFYDNVEIGTEIVDEFRSGSLIIDGSFGDWEMSVKNKEIR